ncbi:MAG: ABC-type spermidine/putrescine transport system, permease component II [halophilic archaeon J07HB67]|nr:MAG: ABC-type spermidine/putrescine transport system, permease component II [halophilic archaeon J07HB67]
MVSRRVQTRRRQAGGGTGSNVAGTAGYRLAYLGVFVFLLAPVVVVAATSLSDANTVAFPPSGLSLRWYGALLASGPWIEATRNSLVVATGTALLSTGLGVAGALGTRKLDGRLADLVTGVAVAPLLVPGVVLGVTLLVFFSEFGLQQEPATIVLAHSLWATPLTYSVMRATFSRYDWQMRDAALDLGAGRLRAFREVVAPNVAAGLAAATLIAFVVSLQEFVMTLFLSGRGSRTVPVKAWNSLRNSLDPLVSVTSTLLVAVVLLVVFAAGVAVGLDRVARDTG